MFLHRAVTLLFILGIGLNTPRAIAQVVAPSSPAPSSTVPTQLPAGVNPNNLPPAVRQQIQQRTGQNPGTNVQTGRTGAQPTNQPATNGRTGNQPAGATATQQGAVVLDANGNPVNPQTDTEAKEKTAAQDDAVKEGIEDAQAREAAELRRKIFGGSIFMDPNMSEAFSPNPATMATPRNYIVGPGDALNIQLYGYSEADFSQKVSPEGNVYFRNQTGIGPVFVSGLTIEQAKERITNRLAKKFVGLQNSAYGARNTYLDVSVGELRSIRVTVTGDAFRPGTYSMSSLATVMNAIYQAGGPSVVGSYRKVQLIRFNKVIATLDLYDYLLNGTQRNDFRLQDNDNIRFVPYISRVEISGTVKRSNIFEMLPGETMERLLYYAGGFTANAYKRIVKVKRLTDREIKVIDVSESEFNTFVIQDGDIVNAEQLLDRFENRVTIEGAVYREGQYSLDENKTLLQLIKSAENLKGDAFTGHITIVRTRDDLSIENLNINLDDILAGRNPDIPLQREDQVIIPSRFDLAEQATLSVQGEVNHPEPFIPYMANMTLNDALIKAGGMKESAAASQVEVIRRKKDVDPTSRTATVAEVFHFNVNRDLTIANDQNKFILAPFDQIVVRKSPNYLEQTYASVEGEVIMPGNYAIVRKDQKISDMVKAAGGLTPFAYVEGATLIRQVKLSADELARRQETIQETADANTKSAVEVEPLSPEKPESIGINLKSIMERPGSQEDLLVQEGDILRIPKKLETVRLQGEVFLPTTVKFRQGQTFQDYISQAGGFTTKSQRKKSFVVYANGSIDRTRRFMLFNIYPRVAPGSEVVVPRKTSAPLSPQQALSMATGITSSIMTLILSILAFRNLR